MIYTYFIQIDILITSIVFSFFLSRLYLHISSRTLINNLSTFDLHLNISISHHNIDSFSLITQYMQ